MPTVHWFYADSDGRHALASESRSHTRAQWALGVPAVMVWGTGWFTRRLRLVVLTHTNAALLLGTSCVCAGILYGIAHTDWGRQRLQSLRSAPDPGAAVEIWRDDPQLGYAHRASSTGSHHTLDFSVRYTIDQDGCRVIPGVRARQDSVLFLGDSFTFGHGVDDAQTFSAVLSAEYWPRVEIRNCGVMGWSTGQAYLLLEQTLAGARLPTAIVYGWTGATLQRNHLRSSWLFALAAHRRRSVHFDLAGENLEYRGTVGPEEAILDDAPDLPERELAVTRALITRMARMCARDSVGFLVVLLATRQSDDVMGDWLRDQGAAQAIEVLDLRSVRGPYFRNDGHPKQAWHGAIARALADQAPQRIGVGSGPSVQ